MFTDTDSLAYEIKSEDVYEEFFKYKHLILVTIQKIQNFLIGKIKDESERKIIDEFVGLKSKMYSIKNIDGKESNTSKRVNIATDFSKFKDTLFNKKVIRHKMRRI